MTDEKELIEKLKSGEITAKEAEKINPDLKFGSDDTRHPDIPNNYVDPKKEEEKELLEQVEDHGNFADYYDDQDKHYR